jgi:teichoic acid transport system ATP-binding protein
MCCEDGMAEDKLDDTIIHVEHVSKVYALYDRPIDRMKEALSIRKKSFHKDHIVLNDFNLDIRRGESVGIVGRNGAGKSTLLKMITGVVTPTAGTVETKGKIAALLELGAGFNMEYTGRENIFLNGRMMGYTRAEMKQRVDSIIEFADIGDFIDQPVKTYSSGMFARLAFAVSINVEPDILIVDEVLSVGDTRFQIKCIQKMKELKEKGTTILFVSHATEQIKQFCTRVIWMLDGHIELDGEASEVVDLYESYMKTGLSLKALLNLQDEHNNQLPDAGEVGRPKADMLASIEDIQINKVRFHTFDELEVAVTYRIYEEKIDGFFLGVAFYSANRLDYIFGPNTHLEKKEVPSTRGLHKVIYKVPRLPLIQGTYVVDVGIFNNEGLVNLDYRMSARTFVVSNKYFSEGTYYINHEWDVEA